MKTLLKIVLAVSAAAMLAGLPLLVSGDLRDKAYRTAVEMPAIYYYFRLRGPMVAREFAAAAQQLNAQLDLVADFAEGRNTMIPGLLFNTHFVLRQATLNKDFATMRPYLERLAATYPDLFPAQLWLARAMLATDPAKAFAAAERAGDLIPSDERPYRLAIEAALLTGEPARIETLCQQYREARLGSYHFYDFNTFFVGSGFREFAIEVIDDKGGAQVVRHAGLSVGEGIEYEFQLEAPVEARAIRFHFATPPGVSVRVGTIRFFLEGRQRFQMAPEQFIVTSRNGFATGNGTVTMARDGETLSIHPKTPPRARADRVNATLTVSRLDLLDHPACAKGGKDR